MDTNDARLVEKARGGSLQAFDALMIRYQRTIVKIAMSFTRDADHALDISQNVFLKAYQKLDTLADPDRFKAWLMRMAYNESLSWQRGKSNGDVLEPDESLEQKIPVEGGQEWAFQRADDRRMLLQLLDLLNPKYRLAVVLKYFEDCSIKDIATTLQCSEDVVKNMLYRSLKRMAGSARRVI
ncbi:Sigma-70 family RNA polymerase sigma factor [Sulfidibacter corallicola]|uniref:Sigma-70 family RNA polymerase sigma factor n=1 Tax=Sulfidibacter corallicola TaxID=2818388 RepID=A0A8A4TKJ5_SULCO|nr:sigma-70 family RNA polymerase sigma factor [Sulfidibacter corallicola]QTD49401.1 sigma-70 family RNA polymerase sigma factor [Sulfidibacter corallicola]